MYNGQVYVFSPGKIYMCWLALVTLCFTYNVSVIPLRGVFPYQSPGNLTYWLICDYLSDLVYLLDVLIFKPRLTFLNSGLLEVRDLVGKFGLKTWNFNFKNMVYQILIHIPGMLINFKYLIFSI